MTATTTVCLDKQVTIYKLILEMYSMITFIRDWNWDRFPMAREKD